MVAAMVALETAVGRAVEATATARAEVEKGVVMVVVATEEQRESEGGYYVVRLLGRQWIKGAALCAVFNGVFALRCCVELLLGVELLRTDRTLRLRAFPPRRTVLSHEVGHEPAGFAAVDDKVEVGHDLEGACAVGSERP